jgi:hypothetical protein
MRRLAFLVVRGGPRALIADAACAEAADPPMPRQAGRVSLYPGRELSFLVFAPQDIARMSA